MLIVGNHPLLPDAAYYANWLSILYDLKDRRRKNLLVFLPKIEDLTLLTLTCLQTKGKRENGSLLLRNLRFAKIRHIGDYFADCCCKIRDEFTDFRVGFCGLTRARIMSVLWAGFLYLLQPKVQRLSIKSKSKYNNWYSDCYSSYRYWNIERMWIILHK